MENLKEVVEIFDLITKTSGKNDKIKIVKKNKDNELFIECLKFLLDSDIVTGLSKKKINKNIQLDNELFIECLKFLLDSDTVTELSKKKINKDIPLEDDKLKLDTIREVMEYLKVHNSGRDVDIAIVREFCNKQTDTNKEFCIGLFTKSLKIGIDVKGVNKAIPNLIPSFDIMLADSYMKCKDKVINKEFILTTKLDGSRICVIKKDDKITLKTRQNKPYEGLIEIENDFKTLPNGVYDGELLAKGKFKNSAEQYKETMKISRKKGIKKGLKMMCYDYIENIEDFYNGKDSTKCIDRKNKLKEILSVDKENIKYLEPLYIGKDLDKIMEFSNLAVQNGEEGIMLSIANSPYECKRSKNLLKVKQFFEGDVYVTDVIEGDNKYKGKLGCVRCKFLYNGEIQDVEVGSGFTDEERKLLFENPNLILNKVITIKYFEISQNSTTKKYSLRFPTISKRYPDFIRMDKTTLEDTNME